MHNPFVPETLEGWSVLHLLYRFDWPRLNSCSAPAREAIAAGAVTALEQTMSGDEAGATAFVQVLGHKADVMLILFRRSFDDLGRAELALAQTELHAYLLPTTSYVSIVELGMYEMTAKVHRLVEQKGLRPESEDYHAAFDALMAEQRQRVAGRLFPAIPAARHVCFYPMDKRRGELQNWYSESFERRAEMMLEHGKIGRHYAGKVTQIISGSIGYDDWEWGVDLFADDALTFKKLIYEMRFDEASAKFAAFGPFYIGLQFAPPDLGKLLKGELPSL
ncbi:MAG: heme-dependent peroxidase [Acidobacteria bacterium]|nr:heme-dependent peroxidase [Acidobacteriota bacterium]